MNIAVKLLKFSLLDSVLLSSGARQFLESIDLSDQLGSLLLDTIHFTHHCLVLFAELVQLGSVRLCFGPMFSCLTRFSLNIRIEQCVLTDESHVFLGSLLQKLL